MNINYIKKNLLEQLYISGYCGRQSPMLVSVPGSYYEDSHVEWSSPGHVASHRILWMQLHRGLQTLIKFCNHVLTLNINLFG